MKQLIISLILITLSFYSYSQCDTANYYPDFCPDNIKQNSNNAKKICIFIYNSNLNLVIEGECNRSGQSDNVNCRNLLDSIEDSLDVSFLSFGDIEKDMGSCLYDKEGNKIEDSFLPIKLLYFKVNNKGSVNIIEFKTSSEVNNDYFIIEHSVDGKNWSIIDKIDGGGNSNIPIKYFSYHYDYNIGINYYRLSQIDWDQKSETFQPIHINNYNNHIELSPNPTSGIINLHTNNFIEIEIYDIVIGLTQYSWNEVKDMNLQQFTEAMAVDLLRGEEVKFENEILNNKTTNNEETRITQLGEPRGDRRRWNPSRGNQTLEGAPVNTKRKNVTGADPELTYWAEEYAKRVDIKIDITQFDTGLYIIRYKIGGEIFTDKIIKK